MERGVSAVDNNNNNNAGGQGQAPPKPSAGSASLANAVINLAAIRDYGKKDLMDALDSVRGKKGLVLDPKFSGPLGLVAEVSMLREHGVEKIYHLAPGRLDTECKNIVYIVRPKVNLMKCIADNIHGHLADGGPKKDYHVYFVPRRTMICERVLEEEGIYGEITFGEYALDLIPFDDDMLSLELETAYKECFLEGDRTSLFYVARSLMKLQAIFGIIPTIRGKGPGAKLVTDMLLRMRREMGSDELPITPEVDQLILIDRDVDMVTPMCTQLTYEGLLDEIFGISNGFVDVDPEVVGGQKTGKKMKIPLNSNDKLFSDMRDANFSTVLPLLNKKAKEIDEYYKQRHGAQTVSQIRDFMKKFSTAQQEHNSLRIHTGIAEKILGVTSAKEFHKKLEAEQNLLAGADLSNDYIEDCIARQEPILKVLRLLILQSLTNSGLKQKQWEFWYREVVQTYGFQYTFVLNNLEKLGLFRKQEGKNVFNVIRKNLNLIVEEVNENTPTDIAYVYSGYAPLSVRIVQAALRASTWKSQVETLKLLPGPTVEEYQSLPDGVQNKDQRNTVTLVFYIGGICFSEMSAIRWLSEQGGYGDIVVATTKLINGNTILNTILEDIKEFNL